jgi:hypothetical protein
MGLDTERMRDFFDWAAKGLPNMGITVESLERQVERENKAMMGESIGVSSLIASLETTLGTANYQGTISGLWNKIRNNAPHFSMPSPRILSVAIKRESKELEASGWRVTWALNEAGDKTQIKLTRIEKGQAGELYES